MNYSIERKTKEYSKRHRQRKWWQRVVSVLACITVFCTTYALVIPAITMTEEVYCGYEEHPEHTEECYELIPVCGFEEGEMQSSSGLAEPICGMDESFHEHTEDCYKQTSVLVCAEQEHVHSEACYEIQTIGEAEQSVVLTCQEQEHVHDEACYETWQELSCTNEGHVHSDNCYANSDSLEERHQHTEACYEKKLICEKPIHVHTLACGSNPDADVENSAVWERTFADVLLTGDWRQDIISIAKTQVGYSESTNNYQVGEDGNTKQGYTRYGAWFGNPYGDWCAMFCSFCLSYANVDRNVVPIASGCEYWVDLLNEAGIYHPAASGYTANPGDLVFFDNDQDNLPDHVGFIYELTEDGFYTIEGNKYDKVVTESYSWSEDTIFGFGEIPQSQASTITAMASDGARITVAGFLPDDAQVLISPVMLSEEELASVFGAESREYYAYDIRIISNGAEWQPNGSVSVTITQPDLVLAEDDALVLSHVDGNTGEASDVYAQVTEDGQIMFEASGFSTWIISKASAASGNLTYEFFATWDASGAELNKLTATASNGKLDNATFLIEYSDDNGMTWNEVEESVVESVKKGTTVTLNATSGLPSLDSRSISRQYRIKSFKDEKNQEYSQIFSIVDFLEQEKFGFSAWVKDAYLSEFGGTSPATMRELYDAFSLYRKLATVTISSEERAGTYYASAMIEPNGNYSYAWQYFDDDNQWQPLTEEDAAEINLSEIELLQHGNKKIRCSVYKVVAETGEKELCGVSNVLSVNPLRDKYDAAIAEINEQLGLGGSSKPDLKIGGDIFTNFFYYDAVAKDPNVPFTTAEEYGDYLAKLYIDEGIDAVRAKWNYYLYDLYDPDFVQYYPGTVADAGDSGLYWPKANDSSFHNVGSGTIKDLNYNYLEQGVDYSNFISALDKTATAAAAGDENTDRRYAIDLTANAQAKTVAPVAMILQVQTSWQMFDLLHANAEAGVTKRTEKGACAVNTELGTLYDIKHALLRFVDYMETNYKGNNLVLGVTETKHGNSTSMFNGSKSGSYVSNDYNQLRQAIIDWDIFGNCEHIHYDSQTLKSAVSNLESDLSGWEDQYGTRINFDDVQKVAVIIGGPTENSAEDNGYGCKLPWSDFAKAGINSVYGIRTNVGIPSAANTSDLISWIDNDDNAGGTPFENGTGNAFTQKYVATNEDAIFNKLVQIAKQEMTKYGLDVTEANAYVENVTIQDTVRREFVLDPSEAITATIYNKDSSVAEKRLLTMNDLSIMENADGTTTVSYNFGQVYNTQKCVLHFGIIAQEDYIGSNNVFTNVGTPDLTYQHTSNDGTAATYTVTSSDTPQVNVPLRFETIDGQKTTVLVGTDVDLGELGSEIPKQVEAMLDDYGQINGTLSYVWELPDGTMQSVGSVQVQDGQPGALPDISAIFTPDQAGNYTGKLKLTFTPESVAADNKNFSDNVTRTAVNPLEKPGNVWIDAVEKGTSRSLIVRKVWEIKPSWDSPKITFRLLAGGADTGKTFTLNDDNNWEIQIDGLESVREDSSGNAQIIRYTVEEIDVPEGYKVSYSEETRTTEISSAKAVFTLYGHSKNNNVRKVNIQVSLADGSSVTKEFTVNGLDDKQSYSFEMDGLPITSAGTPLEISGVSFEFYNDKDKTVDKKNAQLSWKQDTYISGKTSIPVLIITNSAKGYELPETGGVGTLPFTLCGFAMILSGVTIASIRSRRRRERGET